MKLAARRKQYDLLACSATWSIRPSHNFHTHAQVRECTMPELLGGGKFVHHVWYKLRLRSNCSICLRRAGKQRHWCTLQTRPRTSTKRFFFTFFRVVAICTATDSQLQLRTRRNLSRCSRFASPKRLEHLRLREIACLQDCYGRLFYLNAKLETFGLNDNYAHTWCLLPVRSIACMTPLVIVSNLVTLAMHKQARTHARKMHNNRTK